MRRSLCQSRLFLRVASTPSVTTMTTKPAASAVAAASLSSSSSLYASTRHMSATASSPEEAQRESALRQRIQETYKNTKLNPLTQFQYGSFQPSKFAAAASSGGAADSQQQQQQQQSGANNNNNNNNNGNSGNAEGQPQQQQVDWLVLGTGLALVFVTSQALNDRVNGTVLPTHEQYRKDPFLNQFSVPLWCASAEQQAFYLLFLISVEGPARESLRLEYQNALAAQQLPPFTTFFDWLIRYGRLPSFAYGSSPQYDRATVVATLTNALGSGSSMQLAGLGRAMAQTVAESTAATHSSSTASQWFPVLSSTFASASSSSPAMPGVQPNVHDMQHRIDKFMLELQKGGFPLISSSSSRVAVPSPMYATPPHVQQQQYHPNAYGGQNVAPPLGAVGAPSTSSSSSTPYAAAEQLNQRELVLETLKDHNRMGQAVSMSDVLNSVQGK